MLRYLLIFGLTIIMARGELPLSAANHPDFTGSWTTDLNAPESTSIASLLEIQGASLLERKAADSMAVTQVMTQTEKILTINTDAVWSAQSQTLYLDGRIQNQNTKKLGKVQFRSYWNRDGQTLVTVSTFKTADGLNAEWTIHRFLKDNGHTMIVEHTLVLEDGKKIIGKRVLRKQS